MTCMAYAMQRCIALPATAGLLAAWNGRKNSTRQTTGRPPVMCEAKQHVVPPLQNLVDGKDYLVFRRAANGKVVRSTLYALLEDVAKPVNRCVMLGEVHDDPVAHKLQEQIVDHCSRLGEPFTLSLEMFETDVQRPLDEYVLKRTIREQDMLQDCRPWGNYQDYRPLVEICRERGFRVVAANAPRRYVSLVARMGEEALIRLVEDDEGKPLLPPLPLGPMSWQYREKFLQTMSPGVRPANKDPDDSSEGCPFIGFKSSDASSEKTMCAQGLWDHTMAFNLAQALRNGSKVVHLCGAFHCAHGLGIPEALPSYMPSNTGPTEHPWLPIDETLSVDRVAPQQPAKTSPPGSCIVVSWPASIAMTLAMEPRWPSSISAIADWTILTEELHERSWPENEGHVS